MPDPVLYGRTLAVTFLASLGLVCVLRRCLGRNRSTGHAFAAILGVSCAAVVGLALLQIQPRLPPQNGLDRFLVIVLPAALVVELAATSSRLAGRRWAVMLRGIGSAAFGVVLLYGSVHLPPPENFWSGGATWGWLVVWGFALFGQWECLSRFTRRANDVAVPLAVALALACAGLLIMMAGYLKGGSAALPLAAALGGAAWWNRKPEPPGTLSGVTGLGVVALFGLLVIGRYFGGLTTGTALAVFGAPLLAWCPVARASPVSCESCVPPLRQRAWLRLLVVALVLGVLFCRAKLDFDQKMRPLMQERVPHRDHQGLS